MTMLLEAFRRVIDRTTQNERSTSIARIAVVVFLVSGCATPKNTTTPIASTAPPANSVVQNHEPKPLINGFEAQELPVLQFRPTTFHFTDESMQSYQADINAAGNRVARAYSGIRNLFARASRNHSLVKDSTWRNMLTRDLTEFREAGKLMANYPIVPIRAMEEDKAFRPIEGSISNIAYIIGRSLQQDTSEYKGVVVTEVY